MAKEKPVGNQSALSRYLVNTGISAGAGGLLSKKPGLGALIGALAGAAGTGAAEATDMRRGGAGYSGLEQGITGALFGAGATGMAPGGMNAIRYLMAKRGLSKNKAIASLLGAGALMGGGVGGSVGALGGGLSEALEE